MANLGTIDLTKKLSNNDDRVRAIKKLQAELGSLYGTIGIVPQDVQMMVNKLREEFDKEKDVLVKQHAAELKPVQVEFDQLTRRINDELKPQLRSMGRKHVQEQQDIAIKFMELELKVIRPILAKNGKSAIQR